MVHDRLLPHLLHMIVPTTNVAVNSQVPLYL